MGEAHDGEPARLVLVTGHAFGCQAFEGIFSSGAFLAGRVEVALMIGLADTRAQATVGYRSPGGLAAEQGVRYLSTSDGRLSSLAGAIGAARPDYLLVIGWSYLIGRDILALPARGSIGMHPTPLPAGRGQAPIPWTIINGLTTTALTVFFLVEAVDAGPVIAQYDLAVRDRETSASLFYRMGQAHFTAGCELGDLLGGGPVPSVVQDERLATRWPRRRPRDGEIRQTMTRAQIDRLVRAQLGPYPRAFVPDGGGRPLPVRALSEGERPGPADERPGPADGEPDPDNGRIPFQCRDGHVWLVPDGGTIGPDGGTTGPEDGTTGPDGESLPDAAGE